ncbi:tumor necrosis factor receptor superfamily member 5-like isoform X3 [Rhinatrema bivittatum]|uniref:tumor necrosis factor receptor superfamily member 5-like isoform X3 n=1 Tax=Rhinatrema bivittatum TaxID=194408 RepID=UPI0011289349|nr:tumor necrosis factor receptor superfamily member 5-like isoform X3 [Rhinatrema bivittatum]
MGRAPCARNQHRVHGRCCRACPSGTYKLRDCTESAETECKSCEEGTYTQHENYLPKCQTCSYCRGVNLNEASHCNQTHDAQCQCSSGYYCPSRNRGRGTCEYCTRVSACPLGSGVLKTATPWADTVCQICQNGTFSNVTDAFSPCQNYTQCSERGLALKLSGTNSRDSACITDPAAPPAPFWYLSLIMTLPLLIIIVTLITLLWRRPCRKRSTLRLETLRTLNAQPDKCIPAREGRTRREMEPAGLAAGCRSPGSLLTQRRWEKLCLQGTCLVLVGEGQRKLISNTYSGPLLQLPAGPSPCLEKRSAEDEAASLPPPPPLSKKAKYLLCTEQVHAFCHSETAGGPGNYSPETRKGDDACVQLELDGTGLPLKPLENSCPASLATLAASQNLTHMVQPGSESGFSPCDLRSQVQEAPNRGRLQSSQPEEDEWEEGAN